MGAGQRRFCASGNAGGDGDFIGCHFAMAHSPGDLSRAGLGGWSGIDRFSILSEPGAGEPVRARWEARPDGMSGFTGSGVMNHKVSAKSRLWEV